MVAWLVIPSSECCEIVYGTRIKMHRFIVTGLDMVVRNKGCVRTLKSPYFCDYYYDLGHTASVRLPTLLLPNVYRSLRPALGHIQKCCQSGSCANNGTHLSCLRSSIWMSSGETNFSRGSMPKTSFHYSNIHFVPISTFSRSV